MSEALGELLSYPGVWRGVRGGGVSRTVVASGHAALDAVLPGGGWPGRGLTEILLGQWGIGELGLLMPALAGPALPAGWFAWIAPPCIPYAPALSGCGLDLSRVLLVHPRAAVDALWATEQALRSGTCAVVLAWLDAAGDRELRRLQLAAEESGGWGVLFRPSRARSQASPAALRLELEPRPDGLGVRILKSRGGQPATVHLPKRTSRAGRPAAAGALRHPV